MRLTPTAVTILAIVRYSLAQSGDSFGSCVRDCVFDYEVPISCLIDPSGDDSRSLCSCNNFRGDTTDVVSCINDCASEFDFDYTQMFDESCDELFNSGSSDETSTADGPSSPSPTREMNTEEARAATGHSACIVAVAVGIVAALLS